MKVFDKVFGTYSERQIKKIMPLVEAIEALRPKMIELSDEELANKTKEFRARLDKGETLDDLLVEAFAVAREATRRVINTEHFRVQIIGGIILHQNRIAEMKTGEGKTQTDILPVYLNALEGKGVHVVTVNEYLAKRDADWMGAVHKFLGLTVGVSLNAMTPQEKQEAYACDITYVTNNELGFDYLRDNMATYEKDLVLRGLHYAIIDEVDSILIDEARTPLIISGQGTKSTSIYSMADMLAKQLHRGKDIEEVGKLDMILGNVQEETGDFIVNEKDKIITLTEHGVKEAERFFHIDNLADSDNVEIQHCIITALKANNLMMKDKDYIVKDGEIVIIDEFTGRIMPGRRYSDGLHQAIEAKENVKIKRESKTLATITFQNFFNKYDKKAGMTGTALTEEQEFKDIYGMDVVEIPTNRPVARIDLEDSVYITREEKLEAIVNDIVETHKTGQPILVGTVTIEASEELSRLLKKKGIPHTVLNAKFHEMEAEIVANAGQYGAVTIATNMAGRGTDIKLDEQSRAAGGLKVIGTERHESRRIDNQLRGRSGRQGDPGISKFYISLEDDLMRLFGSDRYKSMFQSMGVERGQEIKHKFVSSAIEKAQKRIELRNFDTRKRLLEYDQVMNEQREIIYGERRRVLEGESMRDVIYKMITDIVESAVNHVIGEDQKKEDWDFTELNQILLPIIPLELITPERVKGTRKNELEQQLKGEAVKLYESKEAEFPQVEIIRELERIVLLKAIDSKWMVHIDDMVQLRDGIGLVAYAQKDPVQEYKSEAYAMFEEMTDSIKEQTVTMLMRIRVGNSMEREQTVKITGTNKDDSLAKAPVVKRMEKVYPNDPCPCGSGKKYKQCCGRNA
ncbi:preprotein translocase subunit SecA [Lachnospiraceae bacterium YSD2013]|nr:preprotein translocase subunit SecA [Lachnospiraceae bacterium YSD2013]